MTESKALAIRQSLTPDTWRMIEAIAPAMHKARLFGVSSPDQAAAIMLKGFELGIGLAASFEFIQVIQGKPTISPRGALALIYQSGELAEIKITETANSCTVRMCRTNGVKYETTWSIEDARRAGVVKTGSGWELYPGNMCRWRAIGFCADVVFPDVTGGMKRSDEFGAAIDRQGNVIGDWNAPPVLAAIEPPAKVVVTAITLDELVLEYGAEAVMEAAGGRIPATLEEVAAAAVALETNHDQS